MKVYVYKNCSTCRKALMWLKAHGIRFEKHAIRETPPTSRELKRVLTAYGGEVKRLFNTSGKDYRELGLKDRIAAMSEQEAFDLLTANGNLVKRPFVVGEGVALVGFREAEWKEALDS